MALPMTPDIGEAESALVDADNENLRGEKPSPKETDLQSEQEYIIVPTREGEVGEWEFTEGDVIFRCSPVIYPDTLSECVQE